VKSKHGSMELEKQFDGLKLEVTRMNRFLEHETLANLQNKSDIINVSDPTRGSTAGVEVDAEHEGLWEGHVPVGNAPLVHAVSCVADSRLDSQCFRPEDVILDFALGGQGRLPKMIFFCVCG
jgi:hypothetical protein